jgi:transcriptional regulator with GAF, ATPase, and Fis domain
MLSERLRRGGSESAGGYTEEVRAFKVRLLCDALSRSGGNRAAAARLLGLHPSNLMRMIRELGIDVPAPSRSPGAR